MDAHEQALRAAALPDMFRDRVDPARMVFIDDYTDEGQWDLALEYLVANLDGANSLVTCKERDELKALADSMAMPGDFLEHLRVAAEPAG